MLRELMEMSRGIAEVEFIFFDTFDETASFLLDEAVLNDIRIFFIIGDRARTRNTLCEVLILLCKDYISKLFGL